MTLNVFVDATRDLRTSESCLESLKLFSSHYFAILLRYCTGYQYNCKLNTSVLSNLYKRLLQVHGETFISI